MRNDKKAGQLRKIKVSKLKNLMQTQYERLTDPKWEVIKKHLPIQRKRTYNLRDIVDGSLWVLRVGNLWRNMPESFPPWRNRSSLKAVVG